MARGQRTDEHEWRAILRRWSKSGLSLAEFARCENLRYRTIWDWKRRLGVEGAASDTNLRGRRRREKPRTIGASDEGVAFVPVHVLED